MNDKFKVSSAKFLIKYTLSKLSVEQIEDILKKAYETASIYIPAECADTEYKYIAEKIKNDPESLSEECLMTIFKGVD